MLYAFINPSQKDDESKSHALISAKIEENIVGEVDDSKRLLMRQRFHCGRMDREGIWRSVMGMRKELEGIRKNKGERESNSPSPCLLPSRSSSLASSSILFWTAYQFVPSPLWFYFYFWYEVYFKGTSSTWTGVLEDRTYTSSNMPR